MEAEWMPQLPDVCTRRRLVPPARPLHQGLRLNAYWTRERILRALCLWTDEYGVTPKMTQWRRATPWTPAAQTVVERFGTWNAAVTTAGLRARGVGQTW